MDAHLIEKFDRIGARAKIREAQLGRGLSIDIIRDAAGECYEIRRPRDIGLEAMDVRPRDRHLLLVADEGNRGSGTPTKYLCGHDERHWFVAAVPEKPGVRNVESAKDALMPDAVRELVERAKLPRNARYTRRNRAFIRQGEWFFVAAPDVEVLQKTVLKNEPIRRGAGKPHFCQELYRTGGERVYVRYDYPNGVTQAEYLALPKEVRQRNRWQVMQRDAQVYARGAIRHPDHATIWLIGWHRVLMNTESQSRAMRNVAFLD